MSLDVRDSIVHGKGFFTIERIPKHSVICRVNLVREVTDIHPLDPAKGEFYYHCQWYPDGTQWLVGEPHCYTNHSCEPNIFYYTINKVSYFLAMRDIQEGEELFLEYSLCHIGGQEWDCKCGTPECRGHHRCGFRYMDDARQIQYLPYLDPFIVQVHAGLIGELLQRRLGK